MIQEDFDAENTAEILNYEVTNLHVAYMVVNKTTGDPIALSELERNLVPSAMIVTLEIGENAIETEMNLRVCNETDTNEMIFEPTGDDWSREKLNGLASYMLCLDDPNLVSLDGQYTNGDGTFLTIAWRECGTRALVQG